MFSKGMYHTQYGGNVTTMEVILVATVRIFNVVGCCKYRIRFILPSATGVSRRQKKKNKKKIRFRVSVFRCQFEKKK